MRGNLSPRTPAGRPPPDLSRPRDLRNELTTPHEERDNLYTPHGSFKPSGGGSPPSSDDRGAEETFSSCSEDEKAPDVRAQDAQAPLVTTPPLRSVPPLNEESDILSIFDGTFWVEVGGPGRTNDIYNRLDEIEARLDSIEGSKY